MVMYETIKRIFEKTKNEDAVARAVAKEWITQADGDSILNADAQDIPETE